MLDLPKSIIDDINKAVSILKEIGFTELYIFGSITKKGFDDKSDIDFAVKGIPDNKYFYAIGRLDMELSHKFDLVNLDKDSFFNEILKNSSEMIKIAWWIDI